MRSLLLRILLASLGTILASVVAFVATLAAVVGSVNERLIHHFQARQIEDLVDALAREGATEVSTLLRRLDASLGATHHLVDSRGIDVVTGEDRTVLLTLPRPFFGPPRSGNNLVVVEPSPDGRYRLIGQLTRAFNEMVSRIETLLTAERRLLQDISHELR